MLTKKKLKVLDDEYFDFEGEKATLGKLRSRLVTWAFDCEFLDMYGIEEYQKYHDKIIRLFGEKEYILLIKNLILRNHDT